MQRNIGDFYSYAEIGEALGMSAETVRQIERKALIKLRKILTSKGLSAYLFFDTVRRPSRKP